MPFRPVATVAAGLVLAALPVFLVGGLAVQIREDLGFDEAALGAAVTGSFLVGAMVAPLAGRVADRVGARTSILLGAACSLVGAAGLALLATSWGVLTLFLAIAGLGFAFMDPGLGILVTGTVPTRRQGLAFGVKEAAVPGATLLAGLAIPLIVVAFGWRWAFALAGVPAVVLLALLTGLERPTRSTDEPSASPQPAELAVDDTGPPRRLLLSVAVAAGLGSAAASGVSVFLTESATANGLGASAAGLLLAGGSVAGIIARIGAGVRVDRRPGSALGLMTAMLAVGAVAMLVAATGSIPALVLGTVGSFAAGWGWSGVLFLTLVRLNPAAPGSATGIGLSGLAVGNALGPLAFGVIAQSSSYAAAWATAAGLAGTAAGMLALARRSA